MLRKLRHGERRPLAQPVNTNEKPLQLKSEMESLKARLEPFTHESSKLLPSELARINGEVDPTKPVYRKLDGIIALAFLSNIPTAGLVIGAGYESWATWDNASLFFLLGASAWGLAVNVPLARRLRKLNKEIESLTRIYHVSAATAKAYRAGKIVAGKLEESDLPPAALDRVAELKSIADDRFVELALAGEAAIEGYEEHEANHQIIEVVAELNYLKVLDEERKAALAKASRVKADPVRALPLGSGKAAYHSILAETSVLKKLAKD